MASALSVAVGKLHDSVVKKIGTLQEEYALKVKDSADLPNLIKIKDEINFLSGKEAAYSEVITEIG